MILYLGQNKFIKINKTLSDEIVNPCFGRTSLKSSDVGTYKFPVSTRGPRPHNVRFFKSFRALHLFHVK